MSIDLTEYYGDAHRPTFDADIKLNQNIARFWILSPTTTGLAASLPNAKTVRSHGWVFQIANPSSRDFTVEDFGGTTLATIAAGRSAFVSLLDSTTTDGVWTFSVGQVSSGPGALEDFVDVQTNFDVLVDFDATLTVDDPTSTFVDLDADFVINANFKATLTVDETAPTTNVVSASATGGGNGTLANPYTVKEAGERSQVTRYWLRGGTYSDSDKNTLDAETQAIIGGNSIDDRKEFFAYPGETPVMKRRMRFTNNEHIEINGIHWVIDDGAPWIYIQDGCDDFVVRNCDFEGTQPLLEDGSFIGLYLKVCTNVLIENNKFRRWPGNSSNSGDTIRVFEGGGHTIQNNDFSENDNGHACIQLQNRFDNVVIVGNVFSNGWDRIFTAENEEPEVSASRVGYLFEGNVCFEAEQNEVTQPGTHVGVNTARFGGYHSVARNNIFYLNGPGRDVGEPADIHANVFSTQRIIHKSRIYHNTVIAGVYGGLTWSANDQTFTVKLDDNKFYNNVVYNDLVDSFHYAISLSGSALPWETYEISHNVMKDRLGAKSEIIFLQSLPSQDEQQTVAEAESNFPGVFFNNEEAVPVIVSEAKPATISDRAAWFANFALDAGSPGLSDGKPLARTTSSGSSTNVIPVTDAAPFWAGGFGFNGTYAGDLITVGGNQVRVTGIDIANDTLTVDKPIDFPNNSSVYLQVQGSSTPDLGVWGPEFANGSSGPVNGEPPPPPPTGQQVEYLEATAVDSFDEWDVVGAASKVTAVADSTDSTYITTTVYQDLQRFSAAAPSDIQSGDSIDDVQVEVRQRNMAGKTNANIQIGIRLGPDGNSTLLLSSDGVFETKTTTDLEHPTGGTWSVSDLSNVGFQARQIQSDGTEMQISRMRIKVTYTPSS